MIKTTDNKRMEDILLKIKRKIKLTEKNLKEIEQVLRQRIEDLGTSEAGRISGLSRQYLNDILHREGHNMSYNQVIELAKKLLI